jgi:iron complex outermembrane recepter protein
MAAPGRTEVFTTASGAVSSNIADYTVPVDWYKNSAMRIGGARSRPGNAKEIVTAAKFFAKREFAFRNPLTLQLGFDYTERFRNREYGYHTWRFVGADGVPNSPDDSAAQIGYVNSGPGTDNIYHYDLPERISMTRLYKLYQDNPTWFKYDADRSARLNATSSAAYEMSEKVLAPYVQMEWRLLTNRLHLTGGVRNERSQAKAKGLLVTTDAAYMRYADGTTVRANDKNASGGAMVLNLGTATAVNYQLANAPSVLPAVRTGQPVFLPHIQAAGNAARVAGNTTDSGLNLGRSTIAFTDAVYKRKGAVGHGVNEKYFPSLHASFDISENLVLQAAFAVTQAKPDLASVIIPANQISDDPITSGVATGALGRIIVTNPNVKPWVADNYDLRLTYYNRSGGSIGLGVFRKNVADFVATLDTPPLTATEVEEYARLYPDLGLGPEYTNYTLRTRYNAGSARLEGAEIEGRQNLDFLFPEWARGFNAGGALTYSNRKGANGDELGNDRAWRGTANLRYHARKFSATFTYTMNGELVDNPQITSNGKIGKQVYLRQDLFDLNFSYRVSKWAELFVAGVNVGGEKRTREDQYPERPAWGNMTSSTTIGINYTVGITGSF